MTTTRRSFMAWCALGAAALAAPKNAFAKATQKPGWIGENETAQFSMDAATGEVLHAEHADKRTYIASTTKIMTAAVVFNAIKQGWITLDTKITASDSVAPYETNDSCNMGLKSGDTLTVRELLKGLMVTSANDAAVTLAEGVGAYLNAHDVEKCIRHTDPGVPAGQRHFISCMNSMADGMGLKDTYFRNPNGYLEHGRDVNYSTAREMGMLLRNVTRDHAELCGEYFGLPSFTYKGTTFLNHNELQGKHPGMRGGKSGFTKLAGRCLAVFGRRDNLDVIAVVMHAPTGPHRKLNAIRNTLMARLFDGTHVKQALRHSRRIFSGASGHARRT